MLSSTKTPANPLKNKSEPEQLDLFGRRAHESADTTEHYMCTVTCDQIAATACHYYDLAADQVSLIRNLTVHQRCNEQAVSGWSDYVTGFASTMSFWPTPTEQTFTRVDRDALASDWMAVQSDLNQVWQTITTAERLCDERFGQQRAARQSAHVE
jgi:hypothetical protein